MKMNKFEVGGMFNLDIALGSEEVQHLSKKSKTFFDNINALRNMQQEMLPLFLQSQRMVKMHQNCLMTIERESGGIIPMSMLKLVKEGQQGLFNYDQVL